MSLRSTSQSAQTQDDNGASALISFFFLLSGYLKLKKSAVVISVFVALATAVKLRNGRGRRQFVVLKPRVRKAVSALRDSNNNQFVHGTTKLSTVPYISLVTSCMIQILRDGLFLPRLRRICFGQSTEHIGGPCASVCECGSVCGHV